MPEASIPLACDFIKPLLVVTIWHSKVLPNWPSTTCLKPSDWVMKWIPTAKGRLVINGWAERRQLVSAIKTMYLPRRAVVSTSFGVYLIAFSSSSINKWRHRYGPYRFVLVSVVNGETCYVCMFRSAPEPVYIDLSCLWTFWHQVRFANLGTFLFEQVQLIKPVSQYTNEYLCSTRLHSQSNCS